MSDLIIPEGVSPEPTGHGERPAELATQPAPVIQEPKSEDELPQWARDAITKANKEAADYRGKLRGYEGAFDGMDDDTRDGWLAYISTAQAASAGDETAIAQLREAGLWEEPTVEAPEGEPSVGISKDEILAEVNRMFQERDSKQAEAANIGYLHSEARKLGYEVGTPDYDLLVSIANRIDDPGDRSVLEVADAQVNEWKRAQFDQFMAGKTADARNSITQPTAGGGQPILPAETAKTRMELRERAMNRLQGG